MNDADIVNARRLGGAAKKPQPAQPPKLLLNEGESALFFGVSRRKFADIRKQPWFVEKCTARELGPRALRFVRDELDAAARNAPRVVKQAEPAKLAAARAVKQTV